ncbi:MAG TPA: inositol monophosphatase family protein, partial [Chroococcidiopsis sp.]
MTLSTDQIDKIRWIVSHCGQQARQMAEQQFQVFEKGVDDYVTTVDRLLDEQLLAAFTALFVEDGVITEENTQSRAVFQQDYRRLWMIDPVDGTDDFIHGRAHYSVMVGLLEAYQPVMGWIYAPVFDRLYYGGAETGLFQVEGSAAPLPLVPTRPPAITDSHCPIIIGDKDRRRYGEAIAQRISGAQFSSIGSFGLKVMEVVCGQAGLYVYLNGRVKLWDTTG